MKIGSFGEFEFIERIRKRLPKLKNAVLGIGDDCAVLEFRGDRYLLVTADMLVQDVHFDLSKASPYKVGRKALAVSLSDIAAMAGIPKYYLVSLAVPPSMALAALDDFYTGLIDLAREFDVELVGGDTNRADKFICDICVIGEVEKKYLTKRNGAKVGDGIFVTGALGGSKKSRQYDFTPRVREARMLVQNFKINSMIDISDGLSSDLYHIIDASGVGAVIYDDCIPVSSGAGSAKAALSDGEDFELLFTAPRNTTEADIRSKLNMPIKEIGRIVPKGQGVRIVKGKSKAAELKRTGYRHF